MDTRRESSGGGPGLGDRSAAEVPEEEGVAGGDGSVGDVAEAGPSCTDSMWDTEIVDEYVTSTAAAAGPMRKRAPRRGRGAPATAFVGLTACSSARGCGPGCCGVHIVAGECETDANENSDSDSVEDVVAGKEMATAVQN
eukprot:7198723-Prymnesium_polylepis.1